MDLLGHILILAFRRKTLKNTHKNKEIVHIGLCLSNKLNIKASLIYSEMKLKIFLYDKETYFLIYR